MEIFSDRFKIKQIKEKSQKKLQIFLDRIEDLAEKCKKNTTIALEEGKFFEEENIFGKWYQTFKGKIELEDGSVGIWSFKGSRL